jgi:hypothetical protein
VTVKEPRHGYEEWPDSRPQAPLCGAIPDNVFLISLELGLSPNDEVRQLDHFMDAKEWSALTGQKMKYEAEDYHISRFVTEMLRHATCYWQFPMSAIGLLPIHGRLERRGGIPGEQDEDSKKASWGFPM